MQKNATAVKAAVAFVWALWNRPSKAAGRIGCPPPVTKTPEIARRALARRRDWRYYARLRVISSVVERFVHIEDVGSSNLSSPTIPTR